MEWGLYLDGIRMKIGACCTVAVLAQVKRNSVWIIRLENIMSPQPTAIRTGEWPTYNEQWIFVSLYGFSIRH